MLNDLDSNILVEVFSLEVFKSLASIEKGAATAWYNSLISSCSCGAKCVLDSVLEFLYLNFGGATDLDDSNATSQSTESLLEFFLVILRSCDFDLFLDGLNSLVDIILGASTTHDDGVVLCNDHLLCVSEDGDFRGF